MTTKELIRAEIERLKKHYLDCEEYDYGWNNALDAIYTFLDTLEEPVSEDLEEAAEEWAENEAYGKPDAEFEMAYKGFKAGAEWHDAQIQKLPNSIDEAAEKSAALYYASGGYSPFPNIETAAYKAGFIAGAEWGEKNAYKAIMKKADEVRDKRFDTNYEVKIEPAAGFDFGCVNVYREGKLVGQYVEPKEEKKLPEGVEEAAKKYDESESWRYEALKYPRRDAFKAGAKWQSKRDQETIETAEDHAFLAGSNWQKEQMMKDAVEGEVVKDISNKLAVTAKNINLDGFKFGDKVRVIIVKEEEQ